MSPRPNASIHLMKLAAAQRQLDAAIRMVLQDEDELAVHTVAAAAYRVIRDLKKKRGRSELSDQLNRGFFYIARDLASGKLLEIPQEMKPCTAILRALSDAIRRGAVKDRFDVDIVRSTNTEDVYWRAFNRPANFLKHADLDAQGSLSTDCINNDHLILAASAAYRDLIGDLTPEMTAYALYRFADEWDGPESVLGIPVSELRGTTLTKRRKLCLRMIRDSHKKQL